MSKKLPNTLLPAPAGVRLQVETSSFSGPLPHPDILAKYDAISPGFADRIIKLAEGEAEHRRAQERGQLQADIDARNQSLLAERETMKREYAERRIGQFLAFGIGVFTIGCAFAAAIYGHGGFGAVLGSTSVVGLVSVFIWGRNKSQQPEPGEITEAQDETPQIA